MLKMCMKKTRNFILLQEIDVLLFLFLVLSNIVDLGISIFPNIFAYLPNGSVLLVRLILMGIIFYKNDFSFYKLNIVFLSIFAIVLGVNYCIPGHAKVLNYMFLTSNFLINVVLYLYFSQDLNIKSAFRTFILSSYFIVSTNILLAYIFNFYGTFSQFRYMEFSHSTILYLGFILTDAIRSKSIGKGVFSTLVTTLTLLLSNRAILLNIGVMLIILINRYTKKKNRKKINFSIASIVSICFITLILFKDYIIKILSFFGVYSYTLITFELGNFFSSLSRINIWEDCFVLIKDAPLLGNGIGGSQVHLGLGNYAHNIVLDLLVDYGLILGTILIVTLIILSFIYIKNVWEKIDFDFTMPFLVNALCILLLSRTLYELSEFWISLALLLANAYKIRKLRRNEDENALYFTMGHGFMRKICRFCQEKYSNHKRI